jgi:FkbM family methyltransferase
MNQPTGQTAAKLGLIDIGARGGALAKFAPHLANLDLVLVEPEPAEAARLLAESDDGRKYRVLDVALGPVDSTASFFETDNPYCSSVLLPNQAFLSDYDIAKHFQPKVTTHIPMARYDTLFRTRDLPIPHVIKADVQGYEHQVLQGFGDLLAPCLAIEIETHFYQLYQHQSLIGDLVSYLAGYGFMLRRISNPRSPDLNGDYHFNGDLMEVDAVFTKSRSFMLNLTAEDRALHDLACAVLNVGPYQWT